MRGLRTSYEGVMSIMQLIIISNLAKENTRPGSNAESGESEICMSIHWKGFYHGSRTLRRLCFGNRYIPTSLPPAAHNPIDFWQIIALRQRDRVILEAMRLIAN